MACSSTSGTVHIFEIGKILKKANRYGKSDPNLEKLTNIINRKIAKVKINHEKYIYF